MKRLCLPALLLLLLITFSSCSWFKKENLNEKYSFKNFADKFETKKLPITITVNSIFFDWSPEAKLDTNFVMRYIEPNSTAFDKYSVYKVYSYIPFAKFNINGNLTAYIFIKTKFRNSYHEMYIMKIFNKSGNYVSGFNLSELSGDCHGLKFKQSVIYPNFLIENTNLYITFNKECTTIDNISPLGGERFLINGGGNIEYLNSIKPK